MSVETETELYTLCTDCDEPNFHQLELSAEHGWRMFCPNVGRIHPERKELKRALQNFVTKHCPRMEDELFTALGSAYNALNDAAARLDSDDDPHGARIAREAADKAGEVIQKARA